MKYVDEKATLINYKVDLNEQWVGLPLPFHSHYIKKEKIEDADFSYCQMTCFNNLFLPYCGKANRGSLIKLADW